MYLKKKLIPVGKHILLIDAYGNIDQDKSLRKQDECIFKECYIITENDPDGLHCACT